MCQSEFLDDSTISNEVRLFRRIHLKQIVKDEDTGLSRVSSAAFKDPEMSIHIESILNIEGKSLDFCLLNQPAHKLVSITAGQARQYSQAVCHKPTAEDPSHGVVYGSKKSRHVYDGLRDSAIWEIPVKAPSYAEIDIEKKRIGL